MTKVKLINLGSNKNLVALPNATILFSYETPVAAYISGRGYVRTAEKFSKTTSKHINQWLNGATAEVVPQVMIEDLVEVTV